MATHLPIPVTAPLRYNTGLSGFGGENGVARCLNGEPRHPRGCDAAPFDKRGRGSSSAIPSNGELSLPSPTHCTRPRNNSTPCCIAAQALI